MNIFRNFIPYIEIVFILVLLALCYLGHLSLHETKTQPRLKWILPGLVGLAILSIILLIFVVFS